MSEYSEISYTSFMTINWFCLTKSGDIGQYLHISDHELILLNKICGYWSISPKNLGILINIPKKSGDIDQYPQMKKTIQGAFYIFRHLRHVFFRQMGHLVVKFTKYQFQLHILPIFPKNFIEVSQPWPQLQPQR